MNPVLALWSIPRSISTAVERMMMARGDFKVLHEPFSYYYYVKEQRAAAVHMNVDADAPLNFSEIVASVLNEAENAPVFFKDMSYHVISRADPAFLSNFVNTFIIRDPAITLLSHAKLNPAFTLEEAGYEATSQLVDMVAEQTGETPPIVDAEDIIEDPYGVIKGYSERAGIPFLPESLTWEQGFKEEWKSWEKWHLDAAKSTGFVKDMESFDTSVHDDPRLAEMYAVCKPIYDSLYQRCIRG